MSSAQILIRTAAYAAFQSSLAQLGLQKEFGTNFNISFQYEFRRLHEKELYDKIHALTLKFNNKEWLDFLYFVDNEGMVLYYYIYLSLVQKERVAKDFNDFWQMTNIDEIEPTEYTKEAMANAGESWDKNKHAEQQLLYIFLSGRAYVFIKSIEDMFRGGDDYYTVTFLKASAFGLPEEFPFGGSMFTEQKAYSYGLAFAADLFLIDTKIDVIELQEKYSAPLEIVEEAIKIRTSVLEHFDDSHNHSIKNN